MAKKTLVVKIKTLKLGTTLDFVSMLAMIFDVEIDNIKVSFLAI